MSADLRSVIHRDALVARLIEWVSIESPSHDTLALTGLADALAVAWADLGLVRTIPSPVGPHLVVEIPGQGEAADLAPVLLIGHSDTVWPLGTLAGPVPLVLEGDRLSGPGVYDMKSGLVVMEGALRALAALGLDRRPVRVVIAADEEVGSTSATAVVREAAEGVVAALGFEAPHADGALKVGRLGSTRVMLKVVGREAHAAIDPESGINAIDELLDQLLSLRTAWAGIGQRRPGEVLINVGGITGGGRANVVPGAAEALIGFRFATAEAEAEVMATLTGLLPRREGARIAVDVLSARPTWQAHAEDAALLAQLSALAGRELPGRPAPGAADTNTTGSLGIPTLDGFGPVGGGAHAVDEHISIDSLVERTVLLAEVLAAWR